MRIFFLICSFVLLTACGRVEVSEEFYLQNTLTYEEAAELQNLPNGKELVEFFEGLNVHQKAYFKRSVEFSQLRVMLHMHIDTADVQRERANAMILEITS